MNKRILEPALLFIAIAGFLTTLAVVRELSGLRSEYLGHVAKVGQLKLDPPNKIHFRQLVTGEPDHFAWRVYVPFTGARGGGMSSRIRMGDAPGSARYFSAIGGEARETTAVSYTHLTLPTTPYV